MAELKAGELESMLVVWLVVWRAAPLVDKWVVQLADGTVGNWAADLAETRVEATVGLRVA